MRKEKLNELPTRHRAFGSLCRSGCGTHTKLTIVVLRMYCSRGPCRESTATNTGELRSASEFWFCCYYRRSLVAGIFRRARDVNSLSQHTRERANGKVSLAKVSLRLPRWIDTFIPLTLDKLHFAKLFLITRGLVLSKYALIRRTLRGFFSITRVRYILISILYFYFQFSFWIKIDIIFYIYIFPIKVMNIFSYILYMYNINIEIVLYL